MAQWNLLFYKFVQQIVITWKIKILSSVTENDDYVYGTVLDNYKIG